MSSVLDAIVACARRSAIEREKTARSPVERAAAGASPRAEAFRSTLGARGLRIIAECKRRSPSRGILRPVYDPAAIAAGYERAGAASISVLTEPAFFDGSPDHLRAVRAAVAIPVLRKDFIVTEFQVAEARAIGADAILLIVAALDDGALSALMAHATAYGLAALVEVHSVDEARRAIDAGATIIGVNSRDLKTLQVSRSVFDDVAHALPRDVLAVAESGIRSASDVDRLRELRYDAFLVGERFMTAGDPGGALEGFVRASRAGDRA